nr:CsbD family protein [Streptacidiphilus melanogenes]
MSVAKKLAHKAEAVRGGAKKAAGRATGDRALEAEGRTDQVKGNTRQAGAKVKDALRP